MITMKGESILLNNLYQENNNHIKYLALGDDDTTPQYTNQHLNNEINRTPAHMQYNVNKKALIITADFNTDVIERAKEIGVITNQGDLIAHDIFTTPESTGYDSNITLEYRFTVDTFFKVRTWKQTKYTNVYVTLLTDTVETVYERKTKTGYAPQTNTSLVKETPASFYYNQNTRQLYIHPSVNVEPENLNIYVLTR